MPPKLFTILANIMRMGIGDLKDAVTASDFSNNTAAYMNKVGFQGMSVTILRYGKPFVRLMPIVDSDNREADADASVRRD
jgi:prevent-host-death family protein